jgi:hypothetical protein
MKINLDECTDDWYATNKDSDFVKRNPDKLRHFVSLKGDLPCSIHKVEMETRWNRIEVFTLHHSLDILRLQNVFEKVFVVEGVEYVFDCVKSWDYVESGYGYDETPVDSHYAYLSLVYRDQKRPG